MPDNLVWRNLKSLDFRLRGHHRTAPCLRRNEGSNRFSLCNAWRAATTMTTRGTTAVVGSGATSPRVTLKLSLHLLERSAHPTYRVELAAADDFGNGDAFVRATTLQVQGLSHRPR